MVRVYVWPFMSFDNMVLYWGKEIFVITLYINLKKSIWEENLYI